MTDLNNKKHKENKQDGLSTNPLIQNLEKPVTANSLPLSQKAEENFSSLRYPFQKNLPEAAQILPVAAGVYWIRMPLPFALDHINLWALQDKNNQQAGWTIIDCGLATPETKTHWEKIFETAFDNKPLLRVLATHCHPDHLGLAHWLCDIAKKQTSIPLWMTLGEYAMARIWINESAEGSNVGGQRAAAHFAQHGLIDVERQQALKERRSYYTQWVPELPRSFQRLRDNDTISIGENTWKIILGYGHSPEHASLYCEKLNVLIAGDMLLPRISSNVGVFDIEPEANALHHYLESITRFTHLPEDCLVLPSHGQPFYGIHARVQQLQDHHQLRLDEVRTACTESAKSAADIVPILFKRTLDTHQYVFAISEALAHLNYLWHAKELHRQQKTDGVWRFKCI